MKLRTEALIIKTQNVGDNDRLCTMLTKNNGIIRAFARGARSLKSRLNASTGFLVYGEYQVFCGRDSYIIDDGDVKEIFFSIRENLEKLSAAQFFCEITIALAAEQIGDEGFLRLMLNSVWFLSKGKYLPKQIKAVTQLKALSLAGFMPDLIMCRECGEYAPQTSCFYFEESVVRCESCAGKFPGKSQKINLDVLTAMRHILYSDFSKIYAFSLNEENTNMLDSVAEQYLCTVTARRFKTLDFYKSLTGEIK